MSKKDFVKVNSKVRYIKTKKYTPNYDVIFGTSDTYLFLKKIPSNSVKLIVTSPHYNVGKVYENKQKIEDYIEYQTLVAKECVRILKKNGSVAWEVGNYIYNGEVYPLDYFFYDIFKNKLGLKLRNRIIWKFEHGLHAKLKFSGRYETILWFTKSDDFTFNLDSVRVPQKYPGKTYYKGEKRGLPSGNPLGKNPGDVWEVTLQDWENEVWDIPNVKANHCEKTIHPAQFPIELAQRLILALSNKNEFILDPYGGVGTTALASVLLGRKAISIDRSMQYSNIGVKRLNDMINGNLRIRKIGTKKHIPSGKVAQIPTEWKK